MKTKQPQRTSTRRQPPIVVVPDKTYIDDAGDVIPTDVILISDQTIYLEMQKALRIFEGKPISVLREKGIIK